METIVGFMLPDTFPIALVPEKTGLFILSLCGKTLAEAERMARDEGLEPVVKEILGKGPSWREFSIVDAGMLIPFACRVTERGAPAIH